MAKIGLTLKTLNCLVPQEKAWSLCIGAGCSLPIFPKWDTLAIKLANNVTKLSEEEKTKLKENFSPDIIIQSAFEKSGKKPEEFSLLLSEELYDNFFKGLSPKNRKSLARCLTEQTPIVSLNWRYLLDRVHKAGFSTADELAKVIVESYFGKRGLMSILSFNAELLLPSLINAHASIDQDYHLKMLDYVTEPISSRYLDRIQYVFCHGVVQVPYSSSAAKKRFNAYDKLVFSENEYLRLANSSFAWQSNSFFNILTTNTVFFIGLSFTDPNLRRWLSWIHTCKKEALCKIGANADSTSHYWIEKRPDNLTLQKWYESSVAHLGIRIIWVNDWTEVPQVLRVAVHL